MATAAQRLADATARARKNDEALAEKEAAMPADNTVNAESTTKTTKPKFKVTVTATTEFAIAKAFPFEGLGKVFNKVIIESQDCVGDDGPFSRMVAKFNYRYEGLAEVMGAPSLNINFYEGGSKSISKNGEYDIDGKQGKYRKLNGWNGNAAISKEAVNFVQALIDKKRI